MRVVAVLGAAVLVASCSAESQTASVDRVTSTAPVVQLGAPGEANRTLAPDEQLRITATPHTEADVSFARDMLQHHAQAVVMTGWVDERTDTRDVQLLAKRMSDSQQDEIGQLEDWLLERGETVNDLDDAGGGHGHSAGVAGMLTAEELHRLEAARGQDFDRLFLDFMTRHHEGALVMVAELYAAGGGGEPAMGRMAQHIDSDQRIELARMAGMRAALGEGTGGR